MLENKRIAFARFYCLCNVCFNGKFNRTSCTYEIIEILCPIKFLYINDFKIFYTFSANLYY